jgi:hypothetical protein
LEPHGPFGAKEVGEGSIASVLAAIANAVHDAVGARVKSLPITSGKVLDALGKKKGLVASGDALHDNTRTIKEDLS